MVLRPEMVRSTRSVKWRNYNRKESKRKQGEAKKKGANEPRQQAGGRRRRVDEGKDTATADRCHQMTGSG